MSDNLLEQILHSVARRMKEDFEATRAFQHKGGMGTSREGIFHTFAASHLPGHVEALHNAEIISVNGQRSAQCDTVICDRSTPPLLDSGGYAVVPNECVYGLVEVKSSLDGDGLRQDCEKIRKAKSLPKVAYQKNLGGQRRQAPDDFKPFPTVGMIFAFNSIDPESLGTHFAEWCSEHDRSQCPDAIWLLGKGYLGWLSPDEEALCPSKPGTNLHLVNPVPDGDIIYPLAMYMNVAFATAWMPPFDLMAYASSELGDSRKCWTEMADAGDDEVP
ncbi:DUF6602 domain-containing protein [Streptomyces aurantiacus]|nr:DUF6602 domain-containing protein [Streptomyces aurantiacus]